MRTKAVGEAPQQVAIGNNPERSRVHNRRVVLDVVRAHGPLGRTRIARLTHLTAQAVANIVEELAAEEMLIELGRLRSGRGQPPIQFAINPNGPMTAGIEIAADHVATVLLDLAGQVRASRVSTLTDTRPEQLAAVLPQEIELVRRTMPDWAGKLLGVGVVMPGPFEIEGMTSVGPTTLPGWSGIDAAALFARSTNETVVVENDATAAAVGERLFGAGRHLSNFLMIYFGAGLGLGIIHDGQPLRGAFGNAGEIGHVVTVPNGRPCPCGQNGCLERYASVQALREKLAGAGINSLSGPEMDALYQKGQAAFTEWLDEAAAHLSPMIAMLENIFDPETIVFGGSISDSTADAIISRLAPLPRSVSSRRVRVQPRVIRGQTGQLTAALGAAALPLLETFTPKLDLAASPALSL